MKHSRINALWEQLKEDNPGWPRKRLVTELLELTQEDKASSASARVTGGNGGQRPTIWGFGQSLGAAGLSICRIRRFARSRCRGASVASGFILFVNVGAEWKSFMLSEIDLGAAGTATTSHTQRDRPCRVTALS